MPGISKRSRGWRGREPQRRDPSQSRAIGVRSAIPDQQQLRQL